MLAGHCVVLQHRTAVWRSLRPERSARATQRKPADRVSQIQYTFNARRAQRTADVALESRFLTRQARKLLRILRRVRARRRRAARACTHV